MLASISGISRLWLASSAPDTSVHSSVGTNADQGDFFLNLTTAEIYFCSSGGATSQVWNKAAYTSEVIALIAAIPQADWAQANSSASNFIKNKPTIPAAQIQSNWTQSNNLLPDYILNKPTIPAAQIQSDWSQATIGAVDYIKNKPTIPSAQVQSNWTQVNSSLPDFILNKPTIPASQIQSNWTQSNSSLADYILNKPSIPAAQVQSDWNQVTIGAVDYIKNKPTIPSAQVQSNWTQSNSSLPDYILNKPSIPASQIQSDWNQATTSSVDYIKNKPTIPAAQIQSDWNQSNTSALDYIKNKPTAWSQSSATRTLNTIFQVSATRWSEIRYSVDISTTVSLTGGAVGRVVLEMATNAAFTTGVQELQSFGNGNTGTLVVGLVLTQLTTACLSGKVPPGNYVRLRTVTTTGTPTFTYVSGQEVLQ